MKNKKGFTLIELIVVIAILGILALFLVPSFMGYARDAKVQVMKANIKTGQDALLTAYASYDENESGYVDKVKTKVCENMGNIKCYVDGAGKEYPQIVFTIGAGASAGADVIVYRMDEANYCTYIFPYAEKDSPERWLCYVNGEKVE